MLHESDCRKCEIIKTLILLLIGAFTYMGIEIAYRGYTHWTMGVVGGICFILVGGLNNYVDMNMTIIKQAAIGTCMITALEFLAGVVLNMYLGLGIWDYSGVPFNLYGQICLPFCAAWFGLSIVTIYLDDILRKWLFKQPFPKHKWF